MWVESESKFFDQIDTGHLLGVFLELISGDSEGRNRIETESSVKLPERNSVKEHLV